MSVKAALQSEFIKFIEAEVEELEKADPAAVNGEKPLWYDRTDGPPSIHEFTRSELNRAVRGSMGGPDRALGKVAADKIAVYQRLINHRNSTRLDCFVRNQVRMTQRKLALENLRDTIIRQVTA